MTKIKITTLHSLLQIGKLVFTYTTKNGELREAVGTLKPSEIGAVGKNTLNGMLQNGGLIYFDLDDQSWKTVHAGSEVHAKLSSDNVPFNPLKSNTATQSSSLQNISVPTTPSIINAQALESLLEANLVKFKYIKKSDGSERVALGTRDASRLPSQFSNGLSTTNKAIPYYDVEKQDIRMVSKDSVIEFIGVFDLPLKK